MRSTYIVDMELMEILLPVVDPVNILRLVHRDGTLPDIIISALYDIGLEGAQIEDKVPLTALEKERMFVDILPEGPADDGIAYLSFFVEDSENFLILILRLYLFPRRYHKQIVNVELMEKLLPVINQQRTE